jgi:hypothetical protein
MKIGEDKEVAFGGHHVTKPFKDDTSRLEEGVDREHVDDDAGGKSRQKEVVLRWIASQEKDAVRRATRTFSQDDMRSERRKYLRRVKTSSSRVLKLAWCLFALYWLVCCYLIIVYGVLIYRYMGAGEEGAYITTWGMTFLLVNFGLLSLLIVGRKAFYKTFYNTWRKMFTPHFELNAWYEAYLERVGGVLLERNADGSKAAAAIAPRGASVKVAPIPPAPAPPPHLPPPHTDQGNDDDSFVPLPIDSIVKTRWKAAMTSARAHANLNVAMDFASLSRERMRRTIEAAEVQHATTLQLLHGVEVNDADVDTATIVQDDLLEMVAESHRALERMKVIEGNIEGEREEARKKLLKRLGSKQADENGDGDDADDADDGDDDDGDDGDDGEERRAPVADD